MSGTSCDGISAALVTFRDASFQLDAYRTTPYASALRAHLRAAATLTTPALASLHMRLGELFGRAALALLKSAGVRPSEVDVIGSHGHTVYHGPRDAVPCTLQLGAAAVIAERTGIAVASDFRTRDMAAGGEGAPLMPAFDAACFGQGPPRALQNIGGIANVTLVGRGVTPIAFDTGPGNALIDAAARGITRDRQSMDRGGRLADRGRVDAAALRRLQAHPYFRRRPPKSTGPEAFNATLLTDAFGRRWIGRGADVIATVTELTAWSIAEAYRRFLPKPPAEVIVHGGGALNPSLMRRLAERLAPVPVASIARHGLPPQAREPVAFAWFGACLLTGRPNHLPEGTGARAARLLGSLTPGHAPAPSRLDRRHALARAAQ